MNAVVYVVTSKGRDVYSTMTRISAMSLRITNPNYKSVLALDRTSLAKMQLAHDPLLDEVDHYATFETPHGDDTFRNRFIKTNLRNLIDGQFLYLDSDTLVRSDLSPLFAVSGDIAGAANHSADAIADQIWQDDRSSLATMEWQCRSDVYVNGGLLLWNDTVGARALSQMWHDRWCDVVRRTGRYRDQPALNSALEASRASLTVVAHKYNAQFKKNLSVAKNAAILHYYSSSENYSAGKAWPVTAFEAMVTSALRDGRVHKKAVGSMIRHHHPWKRDAWLDDWVARNVEKSGVLGVADELWLSGRRLKGLKAFARQSMRQRFSS